MSKLVSFFCVFASLICYLVQATPLLCDPRFLSCSLELAQADLKSVEDQIKIESVKVDVDSCQAGKLIINKSYSKWVIDHRDSLVQVRDRFLALDLNGAVEKVWKEVSWTNPNLEQVGVSEIKVTMNDAIKFIRFTNQRLSKKNTDEEKKKVLDFANNPDFSGSSKKVTLSQISAAIDLMNGQFPASLKSEKVTVKVVYDFARIQGLKIDLVLTIRPEALAIESLGFTDSSGKPALSFSSLTQSLLDVTAAGGPPKLDESILWNSLLQDYIFLGQFPIDGVKRYGKLLDSAKLESECYDLAPFPATTSPAAIYHAQATFVDIPKIKQKFGLADDAALFTKALTGIGECKIIDNRAEARADPQKEWKYFLEIKEKRVYINSSNDLAPSESGGFDDRAILMKALKRALMVGFCEIVI